VTLEEAIYARLSADAPLAALVGTRIYPVEAPQGVARPYVVHSRQDTVNMARLGPSPRGPWDRVDLAVMAFADTAEAARAVAAAVRDALDGFSGDGVIGSSRLVGRLQSRLDDAQADPALKSDALLFRILATES
jgi:hypothetical protein